MALNTNHIIEELDGSKCSVIEKNCTMPRAEFLKNLLEYNGFTAVIKKQIAKPGSAEPAPDLFTVGVTDITFNPIKAIYCRELHTPDNHIVTPKYWRQEESVSHDEEWYWEK